MVKYGGNRIFLYVTWALIQLKNNRWWKKQELFVFGQQPTTPRFNGTETPKEQFLCLGEQDTANNLSQKEEMSPGFPWRSWAGGGAARIWESLGDVLGLDAPAQPRGGGAQPKVWAPRKDLFGTEWRLQGVPGSLSIPQPLIHPNLIFPRLFQRTQGLFDGDESCGFAHFQSALVKNQLLLLCPGLWKLCWFLSALIPHCHSPLDYLWAVMDALKGTNKAIKLLPRFNQRLLNVSKSSRA